MRNVLGILLLGLTGCHFPMAGSILDSPSPTGVYGSSSTEVYGSRTLGQPLRASLWFDEYSGLTSFEVSRPAHVAIFALQPMGVLEMAYPRYGGLGGRAFGRGLHSVETRSQAYHLAGYGSRYGSASGSYGAYGSRGTSSPTYLIMIASERALDLGSFRASGFHPWLSRSSITWNPFTATDELAREIVPGSRSSEWTSAYYVTWPDSRFRRYDGRVPTTRVACPGNVRITVPNEALRNGWFRCPDDDRRPSDGTRANTPRITDRVAKRPRPDGPIGATPADRDRPLRGIDKPARPVASEPGSQPLRPERLVRPAKPETSRAQRPTPTPTRPEARPSPSRPEARPGAARTTARPSPTRPSRPSARPAPRTRPEARPRPAPRPAPEPKPAKKKKKGGG